MSWYVHRDEKGGVVIKLYVSEFLAGILGIVGLSLIGGSIALDSSNLWRIGLTVLLLDAMLTGEARRRRQTARYLEADVDRLLMDNRQR